jgi:nicotinamide-nucleotide amidase
VSVEILTIGTELLHGLVRDTNAERIVEHLASAGIEVHYHSTVGDESARLSEALRTANRRAGVVIATGGLGPTSDDLTRKTIATVFRRRLVLDEAILDRLRARFRERGIDMPAMNEVQALVPRGAKVIENTRGSAPGLHFSHQETDFFVLPGVPSEADAMMEQYVLPYLRSTRTGPQVVRRVVRTIGIPESALAEKLQAVEAEKAHVRVGYLPHTSGVDVTISSTAADPAVAEESAARCERRIREIAGDVVYGQGRETLSAAVGTLLLAAKQTLATAESFTGGRIGSVVTETPGASAYYRGSVVAYSNRAKVDLLGVGAATIERHGAVSAETAQEMAAGARERFDCDLALSSTGIAGPDGGSPEKPVGLVYLGLATRAGTTSVRHVFGGSRDEVIARSTSYALDLARRHLLKSAG